MIAVATHGHFDHTGGMAEFDDRRCHEADAGEVREPYPLTLVRERYPDDLDEMFAYYGYEAPDVLVTAVPWEGFDVAGVDDPRVRPDVVRGRRGRDRPGGPNRGGPRTCPVTRRGRSRCGNRPPDCCSPATWSTPTTGSRSTTGQATGRSLARLRALPVTLVHPGHGRSIERDEFVSLIDEVVAAGPATH